MTCSVYRTKLPDILNQILKEKELYEEKTLTHSPCHVTSLVQQCDVIYQPILV